LLLGKKPLEPYNIQYWFKNARAALKRKKRRFIPNETTSIQEYPTKCELDSSDEIDEDADDELVLDDRFDETLVKPFVLDIRIISISLISFTLSFKSS